MADKETQTAFRRHRLALAEQDLLSDVVVRAIEQRHRANEAVLVVATTVARAQEMFSRMQSRLGADQVALLHGRFTAEDRARKEAQLAARVGTGRRAENGCACVLVATQVVEVSLDIDFDVLFSDPAPMEALIQRFGRVNRGRRGGERDVIVCTQLDGGQRVYEIRIVENAIRVLRAFAGVGSRRVQEHDVQGWVDACYGPIADKWVVDISERSARIAETVIAVNRPLSSDRELRERFFEDFDGREVVPLALRGEYERRLNEEPLRAGFLHVPISSGQYNRLMRCGRIVNAEFADVPYTADLGLDLTFRDDGS